MGNAINGTYTLRQLLLLTKQYFKTRFEYNKRDVLKRVYIRKITDLHPDRPNAPSIKYEISTRSYPQYKPYTKNMRGAKQRSVYHDYDTVLEMDELSLDTINWKCKVGSGKKIKKAPKTQVKTIPLDTRKKWGEAKRRELEKAKDKIEIEAIKKKYRDKIKTHVKSAKFLSDGDWQARVQGINLDFAYRDAFAFKYHGHLFGKWEYPLDRPSKLNPKTIMFAPKHLLRILEVLMAKGIIT